MRPSKVIAKALSAGFQRFIQLTRDAPTRFAVPDATSFAVRGHALLPDPVDEPAPQGALAWSPSRGFILNVEDLDEAHLEGEVVLDVSDGVVEAVEGDSPLAVAVRQDRQLTDLRGRVDDLQVRLLDVIEAALDALSCR